MKKNLLLRLCLILMVAVTAYSCRTDQFPENETFNNSTKFQLTSRRISLDEARHKLKLIPEIEKVEAGMKAKTKTNAQGRTVNYGNGVSIDTDDVIYLEGPDFHSYTFRINHENAPADAPVENLVISSRPDGTWKEVLVTYYLTSQEKQNMLSGVAVDFTGKVTHEVLQNGTYSSAMMQGMQNCYWEVSSYYTRCGGKDDHHNGELPVSEGGPCETDTPSVLVVTMVEKCTIALPADTSLGENGEGGGGGPQNGPGGLGGNPPEETVTAPNVPNLATIDPCRKTKASITAANDVLSSIAGQSMDTFLRGKVNADKEWNVGLEQTPAGIKTTPPKEGTKTTSTPDLSTLTGIYIGNGHSHAGEGGQPSGMDMYAIWDRFQIFPNHKYTYVYGSYFGNEEMYALVIDNPSLLADFFAKFPRSENVDEQNHSIKDNSPLGLEFYKAQNHASEGRIDNTSGEYYEPRAVAMAYILEKYNSGISIAKADANGKLRKFNVNVQQITVSGSGAVKEGVKLSQCP